jgi:UDPglucose--hexose-1-phosphate uridylyltransferase
VIESPVHIGSVTELPTAAAALAFRAYADRLAALRSRGDLAYGLVFKNVGAAAGASLEHAHSQVIATALLPPALGIRTARWREEYREQQRTVLQRWRDDELRDGRRVVATTDRFAAICPFASRAPFEMRVVPLQHRPLFEHSDSRELRELAGLVQRIVSQLERVAERPSYNMILHTAPFDTAPHDYYDWHIEILPRLARVAGFEWGTGCFINSLAPEDAAERLRAT